MYNFILGVPGKLKTLLDRLTSTRAANLDNLDATVSTRAPSSTALSSSVWTGTKAGYLDQSLSSTETAISNKIDGLHLEKSTNGILGWNYYSANYYNLTPYIKSAQNSTATSWTDVLNISGQFTLNFLMLHIRHHTFNTNTTYFRITIDGTQVLNSSKGSVVRNWYYPIVGAILPDSASTDILSLTFGGPLIVKSNLKIETYHTNGGGYCYTTALYDYTLI